MTPRIWQRQPHEAPADFNAFAAYLRLKGRRSQRTVAAQTGRSLAAIGRLSAQFNWPARVVAFETRLADATQSAVDSIISGGAAASKSDFEQIRMAEYQLANQVIRESQRWLQLASDPRRRQISLTQICRLTELAFKLKCLATGMPFGDEPRRRKRKEDTPGYWTQPSAAEALQKIYGSDPPAPSEPPAPPPVVPASAIETPPPSPPWPPPDDKRDLTPHALVIGSHGFHCLQPVQSPKDAL